MVTNLSDPLTACNFVPSVLGESISWILRYIGRNRARICRSFKETQVSILSLAGRYETLFVVLARQGT